MDEGNLVTGNTIDASNPHFVYKSPTTSIGGGNVMISEQNKNNNTYLSSRESQKGSVVLPVEVSNNQVDEEGLC